MKILEQYVREFMDKGGQLATAVPLGRMPTDQELALRLSLMREELNEYRSAVISLYAWIRNVVPVATTNDGQTMVGLAVGRDSSNILDDPHGAELLAEVADALLDLLYVTMGAGITWGFPMWQLMDEVQRANMAKVGPGSRRREDGKVLKPEGWQPPDLVKVMRTVRDSIMGMYDPADSAEGALRHHFAKEFGSCDSETRASVLRELTEINIDLARLSFLRGLPEKETADIKEQQKRLERLRQRGIAPPDWVQATVAGDENE